MQIEIIKDSWKRFWNAEEIRFLVLASLGLQFGLVFLSPWRKSTARKPLIVVIWCFYQAADYIAILALSNILKKQNEQGSGDLTIFWAPFLLLHLGGPDTITSYSIEDNELWFRHLIGLAVQAAIAFMVVLGLLSIPRLRLAVAFVFITGFVKYAERTLALRSASMNQLRDSLVKDLDDGPNYAECMQEYIRRRDVQLLVEAYEFFKRFKPIAVDLMLTSEDQEISQTYFWNCTLSNAFKVVELELSFLYDVFHTKAIHIRGICGVMSRFIYLGMISVAFIIFHNCEKHGYVNADIAISYILLGSAVFMELTSLILITTSDWMIVALSRKRWLNFNKLAGVFTCAVSCIFLKGKPRWSNSMKQYNLLSLSLGDKEESLIRRILGTDKVKDLSSVKVVKESSLEKMVKESSLEKMVKSSLEKLVKLLSLKKMVKVLYLDKIVKLSFEKMVKVLLPLEKTVKELWNNFIFVGSVGVPCQLKALLFKDVKQKSTSARDAAGLKKLIYCKGEKALQEEGCSHLRWTIDKEFDESILLWHIATDLCFHIHGNANKDCKTSQGVVGQIHVVANGKCEICDRVVEHINGNNANENCERVVEHINGNTANGPVSYSYSDRKVDSLIMSNYMVYLLIMQPSMMPAARIGKIRFRDTCADAKSFFRAEKKGLTEAEARQALLDMETEINPIQVKGDRSKSVLFDACWLAKELNLMLEDDRWRLISKVWMEMLSYAAVSCKTNYHLKQLSQGGELLTHVWLLMAHMGIGEQFPVETEHAPAILTFND